MVKQQAQAVMGGQEPLSGPVELEAHFALPIPKSWTKRDRALAASGGIKPQGRPDLDNFMKALTDGLNEVVYGDDAQIVSARVTKFYAEEPGVAVSVRMIGPAS
jgi:Holliday junction resolvase RusA-like endonuclease